MENVELSLGLLILLLTMILLTILWVLIKLDNILRIANSMAQDIKAIRNRSKFASEAVGKSV